MCYWTAIYTQSVPDGFLLIAVWSLLTQYSLCGFVLSVSATMPIALRSSGGVTIRRSDFIHGMPCPSIRDRSFSPEQEEDSDSSSSSSIGRNGDSSEDSSDREDSGEAEVQSLFKGPLDTLNALEEGLPVK